MSYNTEIQAARDNGILPYADIYDYQDTPNEELFSNYYEFCRENLDIQSGKFGVEPVIFIYCNYFSSNARAAYGNNIFSITVNLGLIKRCEEFYLHNAALDDFLNQKHPEVIAHFDNPPSVLAFQAATQFTYYHELGHLVQFNRERTEHSLQEHDEQGSAYDEVKHFLEINADSFAAIALAGHFQQFIEKNLSDGFTIAKAETTIAIFSAFLLNHIANFCDNLAEIYYAEHTHPHPFLRLFVVVLNIVHNLNQSPFMVERGVAINAKRLFKDGLDLYEELEDNGIFNTSFKDTMAAAAQQQDKIVAYLGHLIEFNLEAYNNALEEWNKQF